MHHLEEELRSKFGEGILAAEQHYDFPVFVVGRDVLMQVMTSLKNDFGFKFLTTMCGLHMPANIGKELGVMYQLQNMELNQRVRIKIFMPDGDTRVPSITSLWPSANWMERQEYDFFGLEFAGHPDLRRILNMDEMNYFPMRKEYPLEDASRDDKNDKMFGR